MLSKHYWAIYTGKYTKGVCVTEKKQIIEHIQIKDFEVKASCTDVGHEFVVNSDLMKPVWMTKDCITLYTAVDE